MAFKSDDNFMAAIWDNLPKAPDNDHVTLAEGDLNELWLNGFCDTEEFTEEDWAKAFEPHKTPEGSYVLKKEDFLEKEKYRYKGEIKIPFEPLLINEGKYTDEGLQELFELSVIPSCSKPRKEMEDLFEDLKARYREGDNLIKIEMKAKREIAKLIYENPSPMRMRELLFDAMFMQQLIQIEAGKSPILTATPQQTAEVQISTFTALPSQAQMATTKLGSVEKARRPKATGAGDEGVQVKKVRRSRKGVRG